MTLQTAALKIVLASYCDCRETPIETHATNAKRLASEILSQCDTEEADAAIRIAAAHHCEWHSLPIENQAALAISKARMLLEMIQE